MSTSFVSILCITNLKARSIAGQYVQVLLWTPVGSIGLCAREPWAGQQGTMHSATWLLALLPQLECPSLPGCAGRTGSDSSFFPWQSGKSLCWDVTVICPLAESWTRST